MKTNSLKKFGVFVLSALLFTACDPEEPIPGNPIELKNYKYTIVVDGPIDSTDEVHMDITSPGKNPNDTTKNFIVINSTKNHLLGTTNVSFHTLDFDHENKTTYVIESTRPLSYSSFTISIHNNVFDNPRIAVRDLKFSYKIEVNNEVKVSVENQTLTGIGARYNKNYTF